MDQCLFRKSSNSTTFLKIKFRLNPGVSLFQVQVHQIHRLPVILKLVQFDTPRSTSNVRITVTGKTSFRLIGKGIFLVSIIEVDLSCWVGLRGLYSRSGAYHVKRPLKHVSLKKGLLKLDPQGFNTTLFTYRFSSISLKLKHRNFSSV